MNTPDSALTVLNACPDCLVLLLLLLSTAVARTLCYVVALARSVASCTVKGTACTAKTPSISYEGEPRCVLLENDKLG